MPKGMRFKQSCPSHGDIDRKQKMIKKLAKVLEKQAFDLPTVAEKLSKFIYFELAPLHPTKR